MLVSLYTSRVLLEIIGIDNYGIYNVVGGFVGLFGIISGSLINAITRYLTYALGSGDEKHLQKVFSTSVLIQIALSLLLILLAETIGVWFIYNELNIPPDRLTAAFWVFQLSVLGTVSSLLTIPYNACIVSHEKMSIYAYFSIIEVVVKLILIYVLSILPFDKLIGYAIFIFIISSGVQVMNITYCNIKFPESKLKFSFEKNLLREMSGFAGWNFLGNAPNVVNFSVINILLNIFFGLAVNAARGIVAQVEDAIKKFVSSFMTAINPQITKSYAQGDFIYLKSLMSRSSRFGFFLFMFLALPIFIEAPKILSIWLTEVPEDTVIFLRLSMILSSITLIGDASYNVMMATGKIRKFQIIATVSGIFVIPITYLLYKLGAPAYVYYFAMMANYSFVVWSRIHFLKDYIGKIGHMFFLKVIIPIIEVLILSSLLPIICHIFIEESIIRLIMVIFTSFLMSGLSICFCGMTIEERKRVFQLVAKRLSLR